MHNVIKIANAKAQIKGYNSEVTKRKKTNGKRANGKTANGNTAIVLYCNHNYLSNVNKNGEIKQVKEKADNF